MSEELQVNSFKEAETSLKKALNETKAKPQRLEIYVDINRCARCGANHQHVLFKQFLSPIIDTNFSWHYWGMCPYENEPILLNIIQE